VITTNGIHCDSVNTGSRLPICSDVKTRKRRNVVGIDMIRNNRIGCLLFVYYHDSCELSFICYQFHQYQQNGQGWYLTLSEQLYPAVEKYVLLLYLGVPAVTISSNNIDDLELVIVFAGILEVVLRKRSAFVYF
jgi:hypothetical protein